MLTVALKNETRWSMKSHSQFRVLKLGRPISFAFNQDAARHEILENLDAQAMLVVIDWAMKFLPKKIRESQSELFGKRDIPWHISVALTKNANDETELFTFVHAFKSCNQDSSTVLAIIDDVFLAST